MAPHAHPPAKATISWREIALALLLFMQVVGTTIMWKTYEAVSLVSIHEYQINREILPALKNLQDRQGQSPANYRGQATLTPSSP